MIQICEPTLVSRWKTICPAGSCAPAGAATAAVAPATVAMIKSLWVIGRRYTRASTSVLRAQRGCEGPRDPPPRPRLELIRRAAGVARQPPRRGRRPHDGKPPSVRGDGRRPGRQRGERRAGARVPQPRHRVGTGGHQDPPVGAEARAAEEAGRRADDAARPPRGDVPDPRLVAAGAHERPPAGAEGEVL